MCATCRSASGQAHERAPAQAFLDETELFRLRVEGTCEPSTQGALVWPFDETYEVRAEHPAQALERLCSEVEWGIIDSYAGWTVTFLPADEVEA